MASNSLNPVFSAQSESASPPGGELPKAYKPAEHEPGIIAKWDAAGAFHPNPERVLKGGARPYCVLIPPPNVTGALHLGHALNNTLQDILVRAHRMMGYETLWMPGTDHAGIATQAVVERRLRQEEKLKGPLKSSMTREQFVAQVQVWKDEYEARISGQLKAMGASCDYARQRFTMDPICARAVREAFFILFKDGLIYRGKRLVNWDPALQTAVADDECYEEDVDSFFYYLRYPLVHPQTGKKPGSDPQPVTWNELAARGYPGADQHPPEQQAWMTVATTRPETYLGDTAVAVNPKDTRAKALRGLFVELPLIGRVIPMIEDEYVVLPAHMQADPEAAKSDPKAVFATGFLKVTPAHDPNDYEIGQRHKLAMINVLAPDATISDRHGWSDPVELRGGHVFVGLSREDARKKVIAEFKARTVGDSAYHLLEDSKPYRHSVKHSDRSKAVIEPYLSDQWYVRVTDDRLAGAANRALVVEQRSSGELAPGGPALRAGSPQSSDETTDLSVLDSFPFPPIRPEGFVGRDPYPAGQPSPRDLIGHRRYLPHLELEGATYFVTWRLGEVDKLSEEERDLAMSAVRHFDGDRVVLYGAVVMPDHVHCVVRCREGTRLPEWVTSVRRFSAKEINQLRGHSGSLWQDEPFDHIVRDAGYLAEYLQYLAENPVKEGLADKPSAYRWSYFAPSVLEKLMSAGRLDKGGLGGDCLVNVGSRAPGSESRATMRQVNGDGSLRFYPARYAKMYEQWHENIRDWCISRQLWWGHQIPVWTKCGLTEHEADDACEDLQTTLVTGPHSEDDLVLWRKEKDGPTWSVHACFARVDDWALPEIIEKQYGFTRDPDVLDTWFSSALWPLSTLGWPEPSQSEQTRDLLAAFNPTSVLSTAREIITLWVSRMVMMNRYLLPSAAVARLSELGGLSDRHSAEVQRDRTGRVQEGGEDVLPARRAGPPGEPGRGNGPVPFRDVFIHAVVQDGDGKRMSKSAGNGVDPLDIIATHGADAMRFTLAQMSTNTQDVRMPVTRDASGKNTSPKFDVGRNFCNKLWNAARFTLAILERAKKESGGGAVGQNAQPTRELSLVDRWMLSRLASTVKQAERCLANYEFADYVEAVYKLLWWDFCDWYLEAIKPTVDKSPSQQAVLAQALDTILRLLHPVIPFVTESIYAHLKGVRTAPIAGVELGGSSSGLLCTAPWPRVDASLLDEKAEAQFESIRELINAIRNVRSEHQVPPKRRITLHASAGTAQMLKLAPGLVETLAGLETVVTTPAPADKSGGAVAFRSGGAELAVSNLADAVDAGAEKDRLSKQLEQLKKSEAALAGRLANPGYADKAPAKLVEESKSQLAKIRAEMESMRRKLDELGSG